MKKEDSPILEKLGKDAGFRVPDNFFEQFNQKLADSLPEVEITETEIVPSLWQRVRPYVYLAAMFAGVWCMIHLFSIMQKPSDLQNQVARIAEGVQDEKNAEELLLNGIVTDSDIIYNYEDSVAMSNEE